MVIRRETRFSEAMKMILKRQTINDRVINYSDDSTYDESNYDFTRET